MYTVNIVARAKKELRKLPTEISDRICAKLEETRSDPHHFFERLVGVSYYKLRIGDYRIVARIDDNELVVLVIEIDHRRRVYKK